MIVSLFICEKSTTPSKKGNKSHFVTGLSTNAEIIFLQNRINFAETQLLTYITFPAPSGIF